MAADDLFFLDAIRDFIVADFLERGRACVVEIGEWNTFDKTPGDLVVLGLGDFEGQTMAADAHHYTGEIDQGDGTSARSLWADVQRVIVWTAARPPIDATTDLARLARGATQALKRATLAAMWRWHGGAFAWGSGKWLNEARGARIYGGAARFEAFIPLPVWDDANPLIAVTDLVGSAETDLETDTVPAVIPETPDWSDP